LKELALGVLHSQSGFGIGLALGEAIQFRQRDPGPQVFRALRQFPKHLERGCPPQVDAPPLAAVRILGTAQGRWKFT